MRSILYEIVIKFINHIQNEESNRPIHVLYSANGIERLEVLRLYAFSKPKDAVNLLDLYEYTQYMFVDAADGTEVLL